MEQKHFYKSFCARCLTLLVLALLSVSNAWGGTATLSSISTKSVVGTKGGSVSNTFGSSNEVTCTVKRNSGYEPGFYTSSGIVRYYKDDVMTLSVASGKAITKIEFTMNSGTVGTANPTGLSSDSKTWEGSAGSVSFTGGGTVKISSITVTYSESTPSGPSISCADIDDVPYEGVTDATTTVTFSNAEGWTPSVTCDGSIVPSASISGSTLTYSVSANETSVARQGNIYIKLSKSGEDDITKNVIVNQKAYVKDYADLPFEWEGGVKDNLTALDGVTANGLGSDYAASNAPYQVKFDDTGDYIQIKTNEAIGKITIGVKMIGGATTSSITIRESTNGTDFDDVESLSISGSSNDVKTLNSTKDLNSESRYVRFVFNKGANVGVGPITIAKAVVSNEWTVTYDANGGEGAPDPDVVTKGGSITISTTEPTRAGYTFEGWTLTRDGNDIVSGEYTPTANVTLYAKWTATLINLNATAPVGGTYSVKIGEGEAQIITSAESLQAYAGTTIVLTVASVADGYKTASTPFVVNNGEVKVSRSGDNYSFTMPGVETTIAAQFSRTYTITPAECENGSIAKIADKDGNVITSTSKNSKVVVTATPNVGYKVSKLYYIEEGKTEEVDFTENGYFTMPENNVTVYAEFEESNDIVFDFTTDANITGWPIGNSSSASGVNYYGGTYQFDLVWA